MSKERQEGRGTAKKTFYLEGYAGLFRSTAA